MGLFLYKLKGILPGLHHRVESNAKHGRRVTTRSRLTRLECLEQRRLLSAGVESADRRWCESGIEIVKTQEVACDVSWSGTPIDESSSGVPLTIPDEMIPDWAFHREIPRPVVLNGPLASELENDPSPRNSSSLNSNTSLDIVLKKGPNLLANSAASTAFDEAEAILESLFDDPITVVIDVELESMTAGVLGNTSYVTFEFPFDTVRDMMIADRNVPNEDIVASLPSSSTFRAVLPSGWGLTSNVEANRANLLALGTDPESLSGGPDSRYDPMVKRDMAIMFNSDFLWDYDRSDGITGSRYDFVAAVIHEIMHGLGFVSTVDTVDHNLFNGPDIVSPTPLDLFRLRPGDGALDFATSARILSSGGAVMNQVLYDGGMHDFTAAAYTDMTVGDIPMATGQASGDGHVASHFKDNKDLRNYLNVGIMDPTIFDSGVQVEVQSAETRALGLIGWDVADSSQVTIFQTDFTSGLPDGWNIDDGGLDGKTWTDTNPFPRPNPFSGTFMTVDSDWAGTVAMDESLRSGIIDCSAYKNVTLQFTHYFAAYTTENADVDVRLGNGSWQNVARYDGANSSGNVSLDLSAIADGQPDVEIRFRYWNANWEYFWQVDNVRLCGDESVPALDWGDAPDGGAGTTAGNYNTRSSDGGPSHTIIAGLHMGASVDGEDGTLQNAAANADDVAQALPDDEDGLNNPAADLTLSAGTLPTVNVVVTNTTGSTATLFGWIDYNCNGLFENSTERAQIAVPNGIATGIVTLAFPIVPEDFTGTTYARFRLSTDASAANPTGTATDGEVEDYAAKITKPGTGVALSTQKIAHLTNGGPSLNDHDAFGESVASLGDLDEDGVGDLAVGVCLDDTGGLDRGAVFIHFMNADGTVKSFQKIASGTGGGPMLADGSHFGISLTSLGDLDGDGIADLAVGCDRDNTGGPMRGAAHVLFMNSDGTVKSSRKIANGTGGGPTLADNDYFGTSIAALGDLDGDGIVDMAVGARGDDTAGTDRGAIHILFMKPDGTIKSLRKVACDTAGGPSLANSDQFGRSIASLGDLNGDGVTDLAVGALTDDTGGTNRGALYVLQMKVDGTVKNSRKIASNTGGGPALLDEDRFGASIASIGDINGDGITDLAIGVPGDDTTGSNRGALYVLQMDSDGTVKRCQKIASGIGGGPSLNDDDGFGIAVTSTGDLNSDGVTDLAVGVVGDDTGGDGRGAVSLLFLSPPNQPPTVTLVNTTMTIAEDTPTSRPIKIADIVIVDDTLGTNDLILGGTDGPLFEIAGTDLCLQAGLRLDFETNPQLDVTVSVNDTSVGETPDDSASLTIAVTDVADPIEFADFGDAPTAAQSGFATSYPTTLALDGARHMPGGPRLGTYVDSEPDARPAANADGDDTSPNSGLDDEDGVVLAPRLTPGLSDTPLTIHASAPSFLNAWVDFNRNGTWEESEQVATDVSLDTGDSQIQFTVPPDAVPGITYARLRLTGYDTAGTLGPTGLATDGEVEDYAWYIKNAVGSYGRNSLVDVVRPQADAAHQIGVNKTLSGCAVLIDKTSDTNNLTETDRTAISSAAKSNRIDLHVDCVPTATIRNSEETLGIVCRRPHTDRVSGEMDAALLSESDSTRNHFLCYPTYREPIESTNSLWHHDYSIRLSMATGPESRRSGNSPNFHTSSNAETPCDSVAGDSQEARTHQICRNAVHHFDTVWARSSDEEETDDRIEIDNALVYNLIRTGIWM